MAAGSGVGDAGSVALIGYVRVSTAREEMISPDLQRTAISAWCAAHGRKIVGWLEDLDLSGRDFAKRKIDLGIEKIKAGEAAEIGVYRFDRWGRNTIKSLANIQRVEAAGGAVISVTQPFDVRTAVGKYSRTNALALDEMQSDLIGEGWRLALAHRRANGLPSSGYHRFGYTMLPRKQGGDGQYRPDPATAPLLAGAYRRYVAGESLGEIARWWNANGASTFYGNRWAADSVREVLSSGFAAGLLITGNRKNDRREAVFLPGAHDAVIDMDTWQAYNTRRGDIGSRAPKLRRATYRLSGLLVCGYCGGRASHTSDRNKVRGARIVCVNHVHDKTCRPLWLPRQTAEAAVHTWLNEQLAGTGAALAAEVERAAKREASTVTLEAIEREQAEVQRRLGRLTDGWSRGIVPEAAYVVAVADLAARAEELAAGAGAAVDALASAAEPPLEALRAAAEHWLALAPARANEGLRGLVRAVKIYRPDDRLPRVRGLWESVEE